MPRHKMYPPVSKMSPIEYRITGEFCSKQCIAYFIEIGQILSFTFLLLIINEEYYKTSFYMALSCPRQAVFSLSQVSSVIRLVSCNEFMLTFSATYTLYIHESKSFIISMTVSFMSPLFLKTGKLKRCSLIPFYLCLCQWSVFHPINQLQSETSNVIS